MNVYDPDREHDNDNHRLIVNWWARSKPDSGHGAREKVYAREQGLQPCRHVLVRSNARYGPNGHVRLPGTAGEHDSTAVR